MIVSVSPVPGWQQQKSTSAGLYLESPAEPFCDRQRTNHFLRTAWPVLSTLKLTSNAKNGPKMKVFEN
jgi:hypothetical protein